MLWLPETILNEVEVEMGAGETGLRLIAENKKSKFLLPVSHTPTTSLFNDCFLWSN